MKNKIPPVFPPGSKQAAAQAMGRSAAGIPKKISKAESKRRRAFMLAMNKSRRKDA